MGVLVPNYPEENVVKQGDQETGSSNVFQILQDLRIKQYQGKSESKAHRPSTTFYNWYNKAAKSFEKNTKQPARKQVRLICLKFRLLAGPCHLPKPKPKPIPHTVLDDQPLEHINFTHTVDLQLVVACTPTTEPYLQDRKLPALK